MQSRLSCAALLVCAGVTGLWAGKQFPTGPGEQVVPNQFIVRLRAGVNIGSILGTLPPGIAERTIHAAQNIHVLQLPPGLANQVAPFLAASPLVDYFEADHVRHGSIAAPNDPSVGSQWALTTLHAAQAWTILPGQYLTAAAASGQRVRIAVLDTGIDCTHPDFKNAGAASADTAAGGQIVFSMNRAFVASAISSSVCPVMDDHGHGTHVAGTIAAATQNGVGVASVAWPVAVISYKVLDNTGSGTDSAIAQGIMAAADAGIPIVSMSLAGAGYSQALQDAVNYAWARNTLTVAAAGNSSTNVLTFPAGANYAIGVSAVDSNNNFASFSNYGNSIDIAAPGVGILSTSPTYSTTLGLLNYGTLSGTSMAAPHVAAVAGLIAMATPGASAAAIAQRLQQTAQSSIAGGGWNQSLGYGVVDAFAAVSGTLRPATLGGITGQVVDASGLPVGGATVSVPGQSVVTAGDGLFRFPNLYAGDYTVSASASGLPSAPVTVAVAAGADTPISIALTASGTFAGAVTDRGVPVAGAIVQAVANGIASATTVTDGSGNYDLKVTPGTYTLTASALGATGSSSGSLAVASGTAVTANLTIARLGNIAGTVTDGNGAPVSGAALAISGGGITAGATADGSGRYSTIGLPAGTYTVTASASSLPATTISAVTVAADSTTAASLVMGAGSFTPIHVNAGGASYTDPSGNLWSADRGYSGGATWATTSAIAGTTAGPLYQTCRYGVFGYTFPVPNGLYTVILKFAEVSRFGVGQRVFNVAVNGASALGNFDIYAQAGALSALDEYIPVTVTGGQIDIQFTAGSADLPMVNGIDIEQGAVAGGSPSPFSPIRVNAGGASYTDSAAQAWAADAGYSGGAPFSTSAAISNTPSPTLYQTCRYGNFGYTFAAPNGNYTVTLKFAEVSRTGPGQRQFNVAINGAAVLANFDIYAQAGGAFIAIDKSFPVNVTGGSISIQFTSGAVNVPLVSAIDIEAGTGSASGTAARINSGGGTLLDAAGRTWTADNSFSGGTPYSVTSSIANTADPALYQTCRYGVFSYALPVANGNYNVTLKFAEVSRFAPGLRQFNVAINGATVLANFDIYAQAGGALIALDKTFPVTVTGGRIDIQFTTGAADLPMVNAIEVAPQ